MVRDTKHVTHLCGQNVGFLYVSNDINSNHYALQGRTAYFPLGYQLTTIPLRMHVSRLRQDARYRQLGMPYPSTWDMSRLNTTHTHTATSYGFPAMSQRVYLRKPKHLTSKHHSELRTSVPRHIKAASLSLSLLWVMIARCSHKYSVTPTLTLTLNSVP